MHVRTILAPGVLLASLSTGLILSPVEAAQAEALSNAVIITRTADALELAREHDIAIEYYRSEEAFVRRNLDDLTRIRLPEIQGSIASSRNRVQNQADAHSVELQVGASLPLYDGGRRDAQRNAVSAELGLRAIGREEHESQRTASVVELLASYEFAVQAARIGEQHYRRSQVELDARLRDHELGLLTGYELQVMELSVERAAIEVAQRSNTAEDLHSRLRIMLGVEEPVALTIHPTIRPGSDPPSIRNGFGVLLSEALGSDPTIQRLRFERDRTSALRDAMPSALTPVVEGTAGVSMRGEPLPLASPALRFELRFSWPGLRSGYLGFGGGLAFDTGNTASRRLSVQTGSSTRVQSEAALTRRRVDAGQAQEALERGEHELASWIRRALRDYTHLGTVRDTDLEAIALAELVVARTRREAEDGHSRSTAVLEAEYQHAQAQLAELETTFQMVRLYQQLQVRTGLAQP
ncbi:MAG: TolC family protein [Spirochaetaceae bacterium]